MKEKIGMEKEIELNIKLHNLFKEYIENYGGDAKTADSLDYVVIDDGQAFLYGQRTYLYETLISKKFGMVKWLVENDKIGRDRCECRQLYNALKKSEDMHGDKNFSRYERIIMLLAIQDEPIEFLVSILK